MRLRSDSRKVAGTGLRSARERFERRAAQARRRPRLLAAVALTTLALAGIVVWLGWFSSLLTVTSVRVVGAPAAQAKEVTSVAGVPLGTPIMRVDTGAITERLTEHRAYRTVSVSRSLPHSIVITVDPRVAVLAVKNPKGQVDLVDSAGYPFRTVTAAPRGVPLVAAGSEAVTASGLTAAIQALGSLDRTLRAAVSGVSVNGADQVTFTLNVKEGRRTVVWGGPGEERTKARLVKLLLGQPGATIDVSVPSSPVTR